MALATWWRGDSLPELTSLEGFHAATTENIEMLAEMAKLDPAEVERRLQEGHRPYAAWIGDVPTAYGWVATRTAHIGELDVTITLPQRDRYLWDFATLPAWRGRGIYPRLLQAILMAEPHVVERFWIIAAPENRASSAGIAKAGFDSVAHLSFQRVGQPGLVGIGDSGRVVDAAALLQVTVLDADPRHSLSPCWHCAIEAREEGRPVAEVACWPEPSPAELAISSCSCS